MATTNRPACRATCAWRCAIWPATASHGRGENGQALQAIRDERLYRDQYDRFEDYCRERWGWTKTQSNRLIGAAEVSANVAPIGVAPATESQARPLTRLAPEDQADAWQEVVTESETTGQKITAKKVEQVVALWRLCAGPAPNTMADLHFFTLPDRDAHRSCAPGIATVEKKSVSTLSALYKPPKTAQKGIGALKRNPLYIKEKRHYQGSPLPH